MNKLHLQSQGLSWGYYVEEYSWYKVQLFKCSCKMLPLKGNAIELNRKHGNMWRSRTYHPNKEFQTNKLLTSQNISIFITWRLSNPFHTIWSRGEILRPDTFTQSGMFRIFCGEQSFIKEFSGEEKKRILLTTSCLGDFP